MTEKCTMSTLELCEKYFGTRDIYKLMGLDKASGDQEVKKAYHKLSLLVHPDRVPEEQKEDATEKFKVLSKLYQVLISSPKRALYDEKGIIDDEDDDDDEASWLDLWRKTFKPITEEDICNYERDYVNSELERKDIAKSYLEGKGCINHLMSHVPFTKVEDEPRIKKIVEAMIAAGDVPEYKIFTEEPAAKRKKRHRKYARERKESEVVKESLQRRQKQKDEQDLAARGGDLQQMILARRSQRESNFDAMMGRLVEKYVDKDDSEHVDINVFQPKQKKPKKAAKQASEQKLKGVKSGRVKKTKH